MCAIFIVSLFFHYACMKITLIEKIYLIDKEHHKNCVNNIVSNVVDIRYVCIMMLLVITQKLILICIISATIFFSVYVKYIIYAFENRHNILLIHDFDKPLMFVLFLCVWLSVYSIMIPNTFLPYLVSILSSFIVKNFFIDLNI